MKMTIYDLEPVAKPRQTQSSKWNKKPRDLKYLEFSVYVKNLEIEIPDSGFHVIFVRSMPVSWSDKKMDEMRHQPCQSTPDIDNLAKALLDAVFKDDSHVWDVRMSKMWGDRGAIIIIQDIRSEWISGFLNEHLEV